MGLVNTLARFSQSFPSLGITLGSANALKAFAPDIDGSRYATMAIVTAVAFSLAIVALATILSFDPNNLVLFAILSFAFIAFFILKLPEIELNRQTKQMEAELPFTLRMVGVLVGLGIPFSKALFFAAEKQGALGKELRKLVSDVDSGIAMGKALSQWAAQVKSQPMKRAIAQLLSCYEHGQSGKELRAISDELLSAQQHGFRNAATRSSMFGLLFVASVALLPTFFIIIVSLGPALLNANISELVFTLVLLVLFPAISLLILLIAKASLPITAFRANHGIDMRLLFAAFLLIVVAILLPQPYNYAVFVLGAIGLALLLYDKYKKEGRREQIDAMLPDAVLAISSLPKGSKIDRLFIAMEHGGYGALSEEATTALRQLDAGIKPEAVLDDFAIRSNSVRVKRAFEMIIHALNTNSLDRLADVAEDLLKSSEVSRERSTMLGMQKYTLLLGGLLVPAILKAALSLVASMGDLLDPSSAPFLALAARLAPFYISLYGLLVSYYISEMEEKESLVPIYFILLVAAGVIIFSVLSI